MNKSRDDRKYVPAPTDYPVAVLDVPDYIPEWFTPSSLKLNRKDTNLYRALIIDLMREENPDYIENLKRAFKQISKYYPDHGKNTFPLDLWGTVVHLNNPVPKLTMATSSEKKAAVQEAIQTINQLKEIEGPSQAVVQLKRLIEKYELDDWLSTETYNPDELQAYIEYYLDTGRKARRSASGDIIARRACYLLMDLFISHFGLALKETTALLVYAVLKRDIDHNFTKNVYKRILQAP